MSDPFDRAIWLNNLGTDLLESGQDDEAISNFKAALQILKDGLHRYQRTPQIRKERDTSACEHDSSESSLLPGLNVKPVKVPYQPSDSSFVYSHVLRLKSSGRLMLDMNFLSAAIIFNMGLLYHLQGISANTSALEMKSLRLYEMSLGLLSNLDATNLDVTLLSVAALNNISQITYDQGDFTGAQKMMSQLSFHMNRTARSNLFDEIDVQGFMLNVMLTVSPSCARAA